MIASTVNLKSSSKKIISSGDYIGVNDFERYQILGLNTSDDWRDYCRIGDFIFVQGFVSGTVINNKIIIELPYYYNSNWITVNNWISINSVTQTLAGRNNSDPEEFKYFNIERRIDGNIQFSINDVVQIYYSFWYLAAKRISKFQSFSPMELTQWEDNASIVGFSAFTTKQVTIGRLGPVVMVDIFLAGTSNSTSLTLELPHLPMRAGIILNGRITNNGVTATVPGRASWGTANKTLSLTRDATGLAWTASGQKIWAGQIFYFTNE
jgi:hypothetical protein